MTYFLKTGVNFRVTSKDALDLHERLPRGNYQVVMEPDGSFSLNTIDSFGISGKVYGDIPRHSDRILRTFLDRETSTGVLLAGEKGSGKTFLAKYICAEAFRQDIPTLIVNQNFRGDKFSNFIQAIVQPVVVLFDEFEKVYHMHEQNHLLTLLDGVYSSKKLFLLTCNDKQKINANMKNRPGRIYYMIEFSGVDRSFIQEYCQDNLIKTEHIPCICGLASLFTAFNFDLLKGVVEEMNRYNETPTEVIRYLNARPEFEFTDQHQLQCSVQLSVDGNLITPKKNRLTPSLWNGNPLLSNKIQLVYYNTPITSPTPDMIERNQNNDISRIEYLPEGLDPYTMQQIRRECGEVASKGRVYHGTTGMTAQGAPIILEFTTDDLVQVDAANGIYEYSRAINVMDSIANCSKEEDNQKPAVTQLILSKIKKPSLDYQKLMFTKGVKNNAKIT